MDIVIRKTTKDAAAFEVFDPEQIHGHARRRDARAEVREVRSFVPGKPPLAESRPGSGKRA